MIIFNAIFVKLLKKINECMPYIPNNAVQKTPFSDFLREYIY